MNLESVGSDIMGPDSLLDKREVRNLLETKFKDEKINWDKKKEKIKFITPKITDFISEKTRVYMREYTSEGSKITYMRLLYNIHIDMIDYAPPIDDGIAKKGGKVVKWFVEKVMNVFKYNMAIQLFSIMIYTEMSDVINVEDQDPESKIKNVRSFLMNWFIAKDFGAIATPYKNEGQTLLNIQEDELDMREFEFMTCLYQTIMSENLKCNERIKELTKKIKSMNVEKKPGEKK